ncbi:MAG: hypothetical protein SFZ03_09865 [Candidatus Melainabacteria bacterium]|nr:hypothetical protein [Candidatus Melainabacteria bacterium]
MPRTLCYWLSLLLCIVWGLFAQGATAAQASCFPQVQLKPLEAKSARIQLPDSRQPLFVAVGFDHRVQPRLEAALLRVEGLQKSGLPLKLVEIPIIEPQYRRFEGQINPFMRGAVKNKQLLGAVYPYYTDKKQLRARLGLGPQEDVVFLVCAANGNLLWKSTQGAFTSSDLARVRQLMATP